MHTLKQARDCAFSGTPFYRLEIPSDSPLSPDSTSNPPGDSEQGSRQVSTLSGGTSEPQQQASNPPTNPTPDFDTVFGTWPGSKSTMVWELLENYFLTTPEPPTAVNFPIVRVTPAYTLAAQLWEGRSRSRSTRGRSIKVALVVDRPFYFAAVCHHNHEQMEEAEECLNSYVDTAIAAISHNIPFRPFSEEINRGLLDH